MTTLERPQDPTDTDDLRTEVGNSLGIALAKAAPDAQHSLQHVLNDWPGPDRTCDVAVVANALGTAAVQPVTDWLDKIIDGYASRRAKAWPSWLRPRISSTAKPKFVSLTQFANQRSQLVGQLEGGGVPVLITRRGTVVAALVAIEPGSYERATSDDAFAAAKEESRELRAKAAAGK